MLEFRDSPQSRDEEARAEVALSQVFVHLSILGPSAIRVHECADSDLVSVSHPDLYEWTRVVGTSDGSGRNQVRGRGQLLSLDRRLGHRSTIDGPTAQNEVATGSRTDCPTLKPGSPNDLRKVPDAVLLEHVPERMGR